jgi:hypothetical protein
MQQRGAIASCTFRRRARLFAAAPVCCRACLLPRLFAAAPVCCRACLLPRLFAAAASVPPSPAPGRTVENMAGDVGKTFPRPFAAGLQ